MRRPEQTSPLRPETGRRRGASTGRASVFRSQGARSTADELDIVSGGPPTRERRVAAKVRFGMASGLWRRLSRIQRSGREVARRKSTRPLAQNRQAAFLKVIDERYPGVDIHLVLDNYRTHKHPVVKVWLAEHRRFQLHFTPTSASWMNQVETWFSILHRQAIQRGVFRSIRALIATIARFLDTWDEHKHPFSWVKTPSEVMRRPNVKAISAAVH